MLSHGDVSGAGLLAVGFWPWEGYRLDFDVDIVVTWVDGNDPAWLEEKARFSGANDSPNRYRDWGLMRYWFRAIEKNAPWARTIHFVTWGHVPDFLDVSNSRIHVVNHRDFLPAHALPTYNSAAIEMNLHRIEGLAEHFVLFNDDMFLMRPTAKGDFFDPSGKPVLAYAELPLFFKGAHENIRYQHRRANGLAIINRHFEKRETSAVGGFIKSLRSNIPIRDAVRTLALRSVLPSYYTGFQWSHGVSPMRKQTYGRLWAAEPELLAQTTSHRFREPDDIVREVLDEWQLASGDFAPGGIDTVSFRAVDDAIERIAEEIRGKRHALVCINDPDGEIDFAAASDALHRAFEEAFGERCSFEL